MSRSFLLTLAFALLGCTVTDTPAQDQDRERLQQTTDRLEQRLQKMDDYLQSLQRDQELRRRDSDTKAEALNRTGRSCSSSSPARMPKPRACAPTWSSARGKPRN